VRANVKAHSTPEREAQRESNRMAVWRRTQRFVGHTHGNENTLTSKPFEAATIESIGSDSDPIDSCQQ
jgi:hypothetical protein